MSEFLVAPIVEGHGEVQAVPILLRRLLLEVDPGSFLRVNPPLRVKAGSFLNDQAYFANYFQLAALKARQHSRGSVLILLDCEDDCPAVVGPRLAAQGASIQNIPVVVALAHREYETWFIAAARSLRDTCGLPADLDPPPSPESIRDAKGWISSRMRGGYNPPNDQPGLTERFSFDQAAAVDSFARLRRKYARLFAEPSSDSMGCAG